jgi:capsular polysaccharide biosynthesis protein
MGGTSRPVTARVEGILLKGREYTRPEPIYFGLKYIDPASFEYLKELYKFRHNAPKDIGLFRFEGAHIVGQGTVVLADGQLLSDSAAEFLNHGIVPDGFEGTVSDLSFHEKDAVYLRGRTVLVKRPWYRNYGHYLVDLFPILPALCRAGVPIDNIIFGDVPVGVLRTLMSACAAQYFPDADVVFQKDDQPLRAQRLYYVQPVHVPPLFKHPGALDLVRLAAQEVFPSDTSTSLGRKLYISRARTGTRHLTNELEVVELLASKGFTTVYPEEHDFKDQVKMFQAADFVLSVKGAALTNLIFSGPNCNAMLLSHSAFIDPFFWDVCGYTNSNYSEIFCEPTDDRPPSVANIIVDMQLLEDALDANGL